ncbi:MAG: hypothetical protein ACRD4Q_00080 [Candidatus Acidiferrales bacterium]
MAKLSWWTWMWRLIVVGELGGGLCAGLISAFSWQTLHVSWMALYHHPNLLLDAGTLFVSSAIAATVCVVFFLLTLPVFAIVELVSARKRSREEKRELQRSAQRLYDEEVPVGRKR